MFSFNIPQHRRAACQLTSTATRARCDPHRSFPRLPSRSVDLTDLAANAVVNGGGGAFVIREPSHESINRNDRGGMKLLHFPRSQGAIPNQNRSDRPLEKAVEFARPKPKRRRTRRGR